MKSLSSQRPHSSEVLCNASLRVGTKIVGGFCCLPYVPERVIDHGDALDACRAGPQELKKDAIA
jgi:hypothetical protein